MDKGNSQWISFYGYVVLIWSLSYAKYVTIICHCKNNYVWDDVCIPYRVLCWRRSLSSLCTQVAPWECVERPTTFAPKGHYWAHVTSPPCHHPHRTPNPSEQLPNCTFYTADFCAMVSTSSPRSTHDKLLLELTCLFPTRSTTFGRLLLALALAQRGATC